MEYRNLALLVCIVWTFAQATAPAQSPITQNSLPKTPQRAAPRPARPDWLPLAAQEEQQLDKLLVGWEFKNKQVTRYRCRFKRWNFDPVFGPQKEAYIFAEGRIEYSAPDKGLYQTESVLYFTPPARSGEKATYRARSNDPGEHWICDGQSLYEFDYKQKKLFQRELPPDMRGAAIGDGPLPFVFGADAAKIKARYWLRTIPGRSKGGDHFLEAVPKRQADAANLKRVEIIIGKQDFLPKAIQLYPANYDPRTNPSRTVYQFEKPETNFRDLNDLNILRRKFFNPATPPGWEKIVERYVTVQSLQPQRNRAIDQSRRGLAPSFR